MKQLNILTASFLALLLFTFSQCKKNKTINPVDELPPETQTGANTFGCLLNGQLFIPEGGGLSGPSLSCIYQLLLSGTPSGYTFALSATNKKDVSSITTIGFGFDSVKISIGLYNLTHRVNGSGAGVVNLYTNTSPNGDLYSTNTMFQGQLNLKKFDTVNQIASGTFWFDATNSQGKKVEVREGRFDVRYTQ